jgi:hypothetical protein
MRSDTELLKNGNTKCWTALFLGAMVHLGRVGDFSINELRSLEIPRLSGLYFTEEGIQGKCIKCYNESHPALQFGKGVQCDFQTYKVGQKYHLLDKYMMWFHDPILKMLRTPIPEVYLCTGIRF